MIQEGASFSVRMTPGGGLLAVNSRKEEIKVSEDEEERVEVLVVNHSQVGTI